MIACSGNWYGLGIGLRAAIMARGRSPRVIMAARRSILEAIPVQATINLFINWLLYFNLIPRFNQAIVEFTRPLWNLLGHYGSY